MRARIAAMILLLALLVMLLSACGHKGRYNPFEGRFEKYWVNQNTYVLVDVETGVCYLDGDCFRVLLNADGTIATWEGE